MNPAFDPGLQRERTAMAWTRTGLAVLVNALIVLRAGAKEDQVFLLALGCVLLLAAGGAFACGAWRGRRLAQGADPTTPHPLVLATIGVAWLVSLASIAAIVTTAHAADALYATSLRAHSGGSQALAGNLYVIDPDDGTSQLIGAIRVDGTPVGLISIAENPRTHALYGLTAGLSETFPRWLVTLDLETATATMIAPLSTRASDMGFDKDGTLYIWAPDLDRLAKVDLASGVATTLAMDKLIDTAGGGLAIDWRNQRALVAVTGAAGTLDSVDLKTGVATRGPRLTGAPYPTAIDNLTFSPSGALYAVNSSGGAPSHAALVVIDPESGKVRPVGPLPDDVRGLIFGAPRERRASELPLRAIALGVLGVIAAAVIAYAFLHKQAVK